jgi:hypothetical protein
MTEPFEATPGARPVADAPAPAGARPAADAPADAVDRIARATPGVEAVYAAAPDLLGRLRAVVGAEPSSRSHVDAGPPARIVVNVGALADAPVGETAEAVATGVAAISGPEAGVGLPSDAEIRVRGSRIEVRPG